MRTCDNCDQRLTKKMWYRHGRDECQAHFKFIESKHDNGYGVFKDSALSKIKEYGLPFEKHVIQKQRGEGNITVYLTDSTAAFVANIWKGRCLGYLLKEYTTDIGFRQCLESIVETDKAAAIEFCEDAWLSDKMKVNDKKVKAAIIRFVQMTDKSFEALTNESRSLDYGEFKGAQILYSSEIEEIKQAMVTLRKSIRGKCRRENWVR
jgi:hypothetical protein